jgi:CHASE2 domain-containing sensor protein
MRPIAAAHRVSRVAAINMVAAAFGVALAIGIAGFAGKGPLGSLGHVALDGLVRDFAPATAEKHAVVVDIDEISLSAVGQWPWPRYRVAALIEKIAAAKPAGIGLDVLFAEPDRSSLVNIQETFKRDFGIDVSFSGVPEGLTNNDG